MDKLASKGRVVDADTHFWLPAELWQHYLAPEHREPIVSAFEKATEAVKPSSAYVRDAVDKLMKDRAADYPKERLEWMDKEGIDVCVIYPSGTGMLAYLKDGELAAAACRALNRWAAEFASNSPDRLLPCITVPWYDPERALEELKFAADLGLKMAFSSPVPSADYRWSHEVYDPLWAEMEKRGVIMNFHEFTRLAGNGSPMVAREVYRGEYPMTYLCGHTVEVQLTLMDVILGGVCDRFPNLIVGFAEAHAAWLPGWLEMLDSVWERPVTAQARIEKGQGDATMPSEIFKRQMYIAAFPDDRGLDTVASALGADCLTLSTDFPHPQKIEGMPAILDRAYPDMGDDVKRQILGGSFMKVLDRVA